MGSFNVACSASNLSISSGTKIAFIILEPSRGYKIKDGKIPSLSMFTYNDDLYTPVSLPIFGEYDDYGSITDIVRDGNVEAIESYFGIDIYDVINLLTDGRDLLDHCSASLSIYKLDAFRSSAEEKITLENIEKIGFKEDNGIFYKDGTDIKFSYHQDEKNDRYFRFVVTNNELSKEYMDSSLFDLQKKIFNDFSYIISLDSDKQNFVSKLKMFSKFSGMFVNKEIYDTFATRSFDGKKSDKFSDNLCQTPHPVFFEKLGFTIETVTENYSKKLIIKKDEIEFSFEYDQLKVKDETGFYDMARVFSYLDKKGMVLDRTLISGIDIFSEKIKYIVRTLPVIEDKNHFSRMLYRDVLDSLKEIILPASNSSKWRTFSDIYLSPLGTADFSFIDNLRDFYFFSLNLGSSNHLFSPSVNGDQCGDSQMSKLLYKKAYSIVSNEEESKMDELLTDIYIFNKDLKYVEQYLIEIIDDYDISLVPQMTGLSRFEVNMYLKDNTVLEDILKTYLP